MFHIVEWHTSVFSTADKITDATAFDLKTKWDRSLKCCVRVKEMYRSDSVGRL